MVNYIAYRNNEIKHRRALIEALKNDPDKVIAYVSESLLRLCKNAALETGKEINVDFRTMPAEIVDHLKVHFAKEM
jgi:hypothetical protein